MTNIILKIDKLKILRLQRRQLNPDSYFHLKEPRMATATATLQDVQNDLSTLTSNLATVATDQTAVATATTALTGDQTALNSANVQLNTDQATAAATYQQLLTDLSSYYGGGTTPAAKKLHTVFSNHLAAYKARATPPTGLGGWLTFVQGVLTILQQLLPLLPTT